MGNVEKEIQKYLEMDNFETCLHCSFYPGGDTWMCCAPWTDGQMEDDDIDHCQEGVCRYLSGKPGPHLKKLLEQGADYIWIREKGELFVKNPST